MYHVKKMFYPVEIFVFGIICQLFLILVCKLVECLFNCGFQMMFSYSDGVWDPEKWHASLYPTSERSSPVEGFKKDYVDDRIPLKRRIPGK